MKVFVLFWTIQLIEPVKPSPQDNYGNKEFSDSDVWRIKMHIGDNNYRNWYNHFALYCNFQQSLQKKFTNFNYALQHACEIK